MKRERSFVLLITLALLLSIFSNGHQNGAQKHSKHIKEKDHNSNSTHYDIRTFGAVGDGVSDDSEALIEAWKAACKVYGATVEIPSGLNFLLRPVTLQGPCMPHLILQIDGTLLAPPSVASWSKSSLFQWINLKWVSDFTIQGNGTLDGQGSSWWSLSATPQSTNKETTSSPLEMRPTVLRFYASCNIMVRNIHIINSPLCHLKFDSSRGVKVSNIMISSPKDSPNTDGIHLQNTRDVEIKHSNIGCGDDCVSIQTGCANVNIHHLDCSPSHGISLGSLGKGSSLACVSNVSVNTITVQNALSGVRIKTWQGGKGSVKNATFSNIRVSDVEIPIVIDQYYCNKRSCKNKTEAVAISDVTYKGITGTYTYKPLSIACSDSLPCTDLSLIDVQLSPYYESRSHQEAFCWKSYGEAQGSLEPSGVSCLRKNSKLHT
ncbi:uncharacterized protein A4U43_C01F3650 [Asparagus officinalis]|uniref:Polygalacturonase n=1 Tax=Asparagus officinalis TaxID=4686 RepID=A0A5P1FR35_ASPOF|nr:uncharacterized protein A4U43_C01F3650 [Asparagus officinalis]